MAEKCGIDHIENILSKYTRRTMAATPKTAAVLLLLVPENHNCSVILTKRLRSLEHHGGEISFPGGIAESEDRDHRDTALREAKEEIGILPENINILGSLDDELSRWGHRVTPFVGITAKSDFVIQKSEVDRLYQVSLSHLMNPEIYWTERWFRGNAGRTVHFYRYQNDIVWGLTALILNKFLNIISDR